MQYINTYLIIGFIVALVCYLVSDEHKHPEWRPIYHFFDIVLWPVAVYCLIADWIDR